MSKYHSTKTVVDGIKFDSRKEANRYCELKYLERMGVIKNLELQPKFLLLEGFVKNGKRYRPTYYIADFRYYDMQRDKIVIEDVKGVKTEIYKLKKKWFESIYSESIEEI